MDPGQALQRFGPIRGLQVIGFCAFWVRMGCPPLDQLRADLRATMEAQGLSKSAAYRYLGYLREWNSELGRKPEDLEDLARGVGGVVADPQQPKEGTVPIVGKRVVG